MYAGMVARQMGLPVSLRSRSGAVCASGGKQQSLSPSAPSSPVLAALGRVQLRATGVRSAGSCVWSKGYLKRMFVDESKSTAGLKSCY